MGEFPQHDKEHLQKPTPNIIPNNERLNYFPTKIGIKARMSAFTVLIQCYVEGLASVVSKKKK